ncbi:hypothetical protein AIIKEEIJ_01585 [Rhodococcus sp. YH1]|nr:hypothetical protein [Rhodococcus sp. YH1]
MASSSVLTAFAHSAKFPLVLWVLLFGIGMGITTASIPNLVIHSVPADVQASMSSMVQTSQTLIASIFPVAAFTVLNSHVATVIEGYAYYTDTGMVVSYLMCAGASAASLAVAVGLLRRRVHTAEDANATSPEAAALV